MGVGATLSGNSGKVFIKPSTGSNDEMEIMEWTFTEEVSTERYGTSLSSGKTVSEPGNGSASGTVSGKRVTASADKIESVIAAGDQITLLLELDSTGSAEHGIEVPVTIKNLQVGVNPGTGEHEAFSFNYENNGAWTWYTTRPTP